MDFITKLPKSKDPMTKATYDSILVIIDKCTRYAYFIPFIEATSAENCSYVVLREAICEHGLLDKIISDRDAKFTSKFWQTINAKLGIKLSMLTAYYPQTDGITERMN
jgi:transposase InsO family protein